MRIFVIGGTGYIGSVVVERLVESGHQVRGLTRSPAAAGRIEQLGGTAVMGDLENIALLREEARNADTVIQVALGGFLTEMVGEGSRRLARAVDAIVDAIVEETGGAGKKFIFTSGVGIYGDTGMVDPARVVTEEDEPAPPYFYGALANIERQLRRLHGDGHLVTVLRPGQVYGRGGGYIGPIARRFEAARSAGRIHVIPNNNRMTFVHVDDLADGYLLALESGKLDWVYNLSNNHASSGDIAKAVSQAAGLGGAVQEVSEPEMRELEGWASALDFRWSLTADCSKARSDLNWSPKHENVVDEIASLQGKVDIATVYPALRFEGARTTPKPIPDPDPDPDPA